MLFFFLAFARPPFSYISQRSSDAETGSFKKKIPLMEYKIFSAFEAKQFHCNSTDCIYYIIVFIIA